jgi:superfamily II DNA or RNA helicase
MKGVMQLLRKDPTKAYYSNSLYLPKAFFSEAHIASALTYDQGPGKEAFCAYYQDAYHFVVPRNFIQPASFSSFAFPTVDARIKRYPHVKFQSKVTLDLKSQGGCYQREGVEALLAANHGILSLRCGAGKSVCGIHAIHKLEVPGLIIVNEKGLAGQWINEILQFTDLKREDIGFIGDGKFIWQKKLCVALAPTLASKVRNGTLPHELVSWFGVVLADEAHATAGPAFYHLSLTPFHGRRWGLSATPHRTDNFRSLLQYTLGHVVYKYLLPELTPQIFFRSLPTRINYKDPAVIDAITDVRDEVHLQKIYSYLATREDRTTIILEEMRRAYKQGRQILALSQSRAMLDRLALEFPDAGLINGGVNMDKRPELIRDRNPVIAISKLGRQALNKPVLDTLFVLEPYRDPGVLQQLIGRVLRPEPNKQQPLVVFYDDVNIDKMHRICMKIRSLLNRWPEDQGGRLRWKQAGVDRKS